MTESTQKLIEYWLEQSRKMDEEMAQGNPNNRSLVELMKPKQMLYNLNWVLQLDKILEKYSKPDNSQDNG